MSEHAIYAPSSAHRWTHCTASASAISKLPEQETGEAAAEGTVAHEEIERLLGELNYQCVDVNNLPFALPEPNHAHPAAYGIALVVDFVRQLPTGTWWIEQRVRLTDDIWGRCDVAHWHPETETLTIVDYKNGYVDVQAERNEQLQIYAAASIFTHNLPAKWIRHVVVQPNSFMPVARVKQWIQSAADLYEFAKVAAAVPTCELTFTAGEHCRYCPLFGQCPASTDVLVNLSPMLANPPDGVPAHQVATFKACEKPIADWFKALDKDQTKKAIAGSVPDGMKLVTAQTRRAWKDEAAARAAVIEAKGVGALVPPTPAQAEKLGIDVSDLASAPPGGPALAFESDVRKEWKPQSAEEMFGSVVNSS